MIVFDLACGEGHRFEAWFRSNDSFEDQAAAGEIVCPLCHDREIAKAPMAPRVARSAAEPEARVPKEIAGNDEAARAIARLRRMIESTCEDVGPRFAEEARRIHDGDAERRGIYGEASAEEASALRDDGIFCQPMPWWQRRDD